MASKTCGECWWFFRETGNCMNEFNPKHCSSIYSCGSFQPREKAITNGDRLISGGMRKLAKAMVYGYRERDWDGQVTDGMLYTWHLPNAKAFTEYNEAVDFLENWLNAPADCVKQNGNHDTQADLCKADNTESEVGK